jgi:hypothetical protein
MLALFPAAPVPLKLLVRYSLVVPWTSSPAMIPVVIPPTGRYPRIKGWDPLIVDPTRVIVPRAIPAPFPRTPPPTIVEKDVHIYFRDNIDISLGDHYHLWWCGKYDGWRQRNADAYIHPCHCWNRKYKYQRQKNGSN